MCSAVEPKNVGIACSIHDLSDRGCRIDPIPEGIGCQDRVALRLAGHGPIEGRVEWLQPDRGAGVHFNRPISAETFRKVLARHRRLQARDAPSAQDLMVLRGELTSLM